MAIVVESTPFTTLSADDPAQCFRQLIRAGYMATSASTAVIGLDDKLVDDEFNALSSGYTRTRDICCHDQFFNALDYALSQDKALLLLSSLPEIQAELKIIQAAHAIFTTNSTELPTTMTNLAYWLKVIHVQTVIELLIRSPSRIIAQYRKSYPMLQYETIEPMLKAVQNEVESSDNNDLIDCETNRVNWANAGIAIHKFYNFIMQPQLTMTDLDIGWLRTSRFFTIGKIILVMVMRSTKKLPHLAASVPHGVKANDGHVIILWNDQLDHTTAKWTSIVTKRGESSSSLQSVYPRTLRQPAWLYADYSTVSNTESKAELSYISSFQQLQFCKEVTIDRLSLLQCNATFDGPCRNIYPFQDARCTSCRLPRIKQKCNQCSNHVYTVIASVCKHHANIIKKEFTSPAFKYTLDTLVAEKFANMMLVPEPTTMVPEPTTMVPEPTTMVPEPTIMAPEFDSKIKIKEHDNRDDHDTAIKKTGKKRSRSPTRSVDEKASKLVKSETSDNASANMMNANTALIGDITSLISLPSSPPSSLPSPVLVPVKRGRGRPPKNPSEKKSKVKASKKVKATKKKVPKSRAKKQPMPRVRPAATVEDADDDDDDGRPLVHLLYKPAAMPITRCAVEALNPPLLSSLHEINSTTIVM